MIKLVGSLFLISGSVGYGVCMITSMKKQIQDLRDVNYFIKLLRSGISYRKETIAEACQSAGERLTGSIQNMALQIANRMREERHISFKRAWEIYANEYLNASAIHLNEKKLILKFPDYIGFSDENMQLNVIDDFLERLESEVESREKRIPEQKKVIMGVSIVSGLLLAILLL